VAVVRSALVAEFGLMRRTSVIRGEAEVARHDEFDGLEQGPNDHGPQPYVEITR
jgi:hypothetical protein